MGNSLSGTNVVVGYAKDDKSDFATSSSSSSGAAISHVVLLKVSKVLQATNRSLVTLNPDLDKHLMALNVRQIDLSHNFLTDIRVTNLGGPLSNLLSLDLSDNQLLCLPSDLGELSNLLFLDVSHNKLTSLPASLNNLRELKTLKASHNQIKELPVDMRSMESLNWVDLRNNQLHALPASIARIKSLRTLLVLDNPLLTRENVDQLQQQEKHSTTSNNLPAKSDNIKPTLSLRELCARAIVRHSLPVDGDVPQEIKSLLASAHECTACGGPYFSEPIKRYRFIRRAGLSIPLEHHLCVVHWSNESQRVRFLFQPKPSTAPSVILLPSQSTNGSNDKLIQPTVSSSRLSTDTSKSSPSSSSSSSSPTSTRKTTAISTPSSPIGITVTSSSSSSSSSSASSSPAMSTIESSMHLPCSSECLHAPRPAAPRLPPVHSAKIVTSNTPSDNRRGSLNNILNHRKVSFSCAPDVHVNHTTDDVSGALMFV